MAQQSPLISIPRKSTTDIDWTGPLRTIIAQSYGEDPNAYSEECSVLSRCRQDATRGAGSDQTARDLLYKYFGQLELLELRFSEIKVSFTWNDAFTTKPTTQTSLAFEKASIIHLLSAVLSQLASSGSRADPEGVKRAYFSTRASSGMLTYINENFLHAPSTDLSREVVHLLIGIMSAQSSEIFTEKLVEEKKAPTLVARAANQAAAQYNTVVDEIKEFQGKGIVDKNWLSIIQIKAKFFISVAQYYRSIADGAAGKHGAALVRLKLADTAAQEAQRLAYTFTYTFVSSATPTLPHDASSSLHEITKAHATLCSEAKTQAQKDNDLIYHEILPSEASLPAIDKLPAAAPITIQEIFSNPDVSKLIGPDIFGKLVPLAVHESASVYSEEKAKVVRQEVERCDMNEGEIQAGLEHLGFPRLIRIWQNLAEDDDSGNGDVEISGVLARLAEEVTNGGSLDHLVGSLDSQRERCERELRELNGQLDNENRECERARAKYSPQFTQSPSGQQTAHLRNNISSNLGTLSTAASSDAHVVQLSRSIQADIALLSSGRDRLEQIARDVAAGKQAPQQPAANMSLLDLEDDYGVSEPKKSGLDEGERENLRKAVSEATEKMDRMGKIRRERDEVLKDLKEKIQNDDVSSLLMLNRRTQGVEPQLFATELEKFRPYQGRLAAAVQASQSILQELEMLAGQVERGKGVKERQRAQKDRARRVREWETQLRNAGETYNEVKAGLGKGTSYYDSLQTVIADLRREVKNFVSSRDAERSRMVSEIETRQRLGSSPPPVPSSHTPSRGLESQMAGMSLGSGGRSYGSTSPYSSPAPPAPQRPYGGSAYPPPPTQASTPSFPPPPPSAPKTSSYSSSAYPSIPSSYASAPPPSAQAYPSHPPPSQAPAQRQGSYGYPSATSSSSSSASYMPPPPPSRPAQASMYGAPPPSQQYPAPPASSGYQSPSYQHPPSSQYQPPSQAYPSAPQPPAHATSPPPTGYPSYGAQQPHQPYSPYPAPPPPGPPQTQHNAYQPPPPGPPQPQQNTYHPPPPPPQGYGGYQPPQSEYPYR